ncbi:reverse transcriptase, partial [Bacillus cereus]
VTGSQLKRMTWTPIVRHTVIVYNYTPFNKDLKEYFEKRDVKDFDRNNVAYRQKLAKRQKYSCPMCGHSISDFSEELETHHKTPRVQGGGDEYTNL